MTQRLELISGIRFPQDNELPAGTDIVQLKADFERAQIVPGYKITLPEEPQPFQFYAVCNVVPDQLWKLFTALSQLLPADAVGILNLTNDEPAYGEDSTRDRLLEIFGEYSYELAHDPYLEFGIMSVSEDPFSEVFVRATKSLQFWGNDLTGFKKVMEAFALPENEELRLIDEFPVLLEPLSPPHKDFSLVYANLSANLL